MLGAIIGDIVGSIYEFYNYKGEDFNFFTPNNYFTDDSVLTIAVMDAFNKSKADFSDFETNLVKSVKEIGRKYPNAGYGGRFYYWLNSNNSKPYNSLGNGAVMRVSPCGWIAQSEEQAKLLGNLSAGITHNHPDSLAAAELISLGIYMLRNGKSKEDFLKEVKKVYNHDFLNDFNIDSIREFYKFDVTCVGSVPQAIEAFLEGDSYEDVIRKAISIGGDSDTIAAIAGSLAEAYYGIPENIKKEGINYLDEYLINIINEFKKTLEKKNSL